MAPQQPFAVSTRGSSGPGHSARLPAALTERSAAAPLALFLLRAAGLRRFRLILVTLCVYYTHLVISKAAVGGREAGAADAMLPWATTRHWERVRSFVKLCLRFFNPVSTFKVGVRVLGGR